MRKYSNTWGVFCGIAVFLPFNYPAFAETKFVDITLQVEANQKFDTLMQQAESTAINLIEYQKLQKLELL